MRAQIVVALVVALTLIAVPLYLMRRPSGEKKAAPDAGAADAGKPAASAVAPAPLDAGKPPERIRLAQPQRLRCGARPKGGQEGNLCDQLAPLEEALAKSIREGESCAPHLKDNGTVNFVLNVDFGKRTLHLFPGASGDYHGPQARRTTNCVLHGLAKPEWESIKHQYRYYTLSILTTYLPVTPSSGVAGQPKFE